ncbi:conserved Plasmodium protein, unknown function [Plasmodium gallinaceum]|uniref:LsmAD domain-containing protein n=1 Tax=Plasmodium gallinaceum TaxID=5849 RepID=A0A1J1GTM3_PLAGA|nr:conserved Plasmodium protein, unknown function [Plasmodium gallinaceum]CRG95860.1 conserved Plasmodium protein, unknown function [Plasmodium gallinaceum]
MRKTESGNLQNMNKNINQERLAYVMTCLIGNEVNVHMKDGNEIKGLFHAYNSTIKDDKKEVDISLNYARILPKNDKVSGPINKAMIIPENLFTIIIGKNINLDLKDPDEIKNVKEKFKIDADISEKKKLNSNTANRELKRWICDNNDFDDSKLKLDDDLNEPWDQFEHNRKLYGVTTTYKEEIYTTNLDINKIPHHVKIQADKIAKELEYRGMHLDPEDAERDNKELDEEDLFGAVRQNKEKFAKNQKFKKDDNKNKSYQGKFHHLTIKDLKEKIQLVKKENEKKYPTNKQKKINFTISSSNDENNSTNKKNKVSSKNPINKNSEFIGINALNLEPALPKLDEKTRTEWIMFKNQTKNKTNKKDKTTEKQEFITASREFNEKLANKINLNKKETNTKSNKENSGLNHLSIDNQKNVSNITESSKYNNINELDENKMTGSGTMLNNNMNFNNSNFNANVMLNNPSLRPYDPYFLNFNNFNNMKNNMIAHNIDYYQNLSLMPESQNQIYPCADPHLYKNGGIRSIYPHNHMEGFKSNFHINPQLLHQNMNIDVMLNKFQNSMSSINKDQNHSKVHNDLCPFTVKVVETNRSFSAFMNNILKYSKQEDCMSCPVEFESTHQFSYRNILGEIPACTPINNYQSNNFPNNIPVQNISNMLVNFPFIPIISPSINSHYIENPIYFNPCFRSYYPNNSLPVNSNNPYVFNMPSSNIDANYSSNKNINIYPLRTPHLQNSHMNLPVSSCFSPNINYGINNNSLNMMGNPNLPNSNINIPAYPPEFVLMNAQKYSNSQSAHVPFFPQYQYQNYYASSHGMNHT